MADLTARGFFNLSTLSFNLDMADLTARGLFNLSTLSFNLGLADLAARGFFNLSTLTFNLGLADLPARAAVVMGCENFGACGGKCDGKSSVSADTRVLPT